MVVHVMCKNEEEPLKNEGAKVLKSLTSFKSGIFSEAQGQLTPQSMVESGRISN